MARTLAIFIVFGTWLIPGSGDIAPALAVELCAQDSVTYTETASVATNTTVAKQSEAAKRAFTKSLQNSRKKNRDYRGALIPKSVDCQTVVESGRRFMRCRTTVCKNRN